MQRLRFPNFRRDFIDSRHVGTHVLKCYDIIDDLIRKK
jgi:hypothetical protein